MASPLRRSTRAARTTDPSNTTPEPSIASPSISPSRSDRKRKRADDPSHPPTNLNGADEHMAEAAPDASANEPKEASSVLSSGQGDADADADADADVDMEVSAAQKQRLPKHIQTLLGMPGSSITSIHAAKRTDSGFNAAAQQVEELVLSEQDAQKLAVILAAVDTSDLIALAPQPAPKGKLRGTNGTSDVKHTLQDMLRPGTSLRELSTHVQGLREPLLSKPHVSQHLQAGHSASASQEIKKDLKTLSGLTLVLSLVNQLASRQRQAGTSTDALKGQILASIVEDRANLAEAKIARQQGSANGAMDDDNPVRIKPLGSPAVDPSSNRYALHMRLPRGDYFTKAIPLDQAQLRQLDSAQADLVQISAQSEEQMRALKRQSLVPTPALGQRLGRTGHRHRADSKRAASRQQGRPHAVSFLNYGNYSSFAPTYDSSSSSVNYATSSNLWRNSVRVQHAVSSAWGDKPFLSYDEEEFEEDDLDEDAPGEPLPYSTATKTLGSADVGADVSMDAVESDDLERILQSLIQGVDPGSVSKSLIKLDQDELVTSHLRFNMMLLHRLQEFQWARLRRSHRPSASGRISSAVEDVAPSAEEEATAALLLESLSSLVALQPRAVDLASNAVDSVVPDASKLRAFSASSGAIDPDLLGDVRDGFWGALDANVVKVTKAGSVISETPLVLRDDVTIRLVDGSGSKAKKSSRRAGPGAGHVEDRGRGALERFAASRTYDHNQDRHDIEPVRADAVVAAAGEQRDIPPPAMRGAAMSPNVRMQTGYVPGAGTAMTPQSQRYAPGPNASYAFASPGGGLSHPGRHLAPNAQPNYHHGQATRQS